MVGLLAGFMANVTCGMSGSEIRDEHSPLCSLELWVCEHRLLSSLELRCVAHCVVLLTND